MAAARRGLAICALASLAALAGCNDLPGFLAADTAAPAAEALAPAEIETTVLDAPGDARAEPDTPEPEPDMAAEDAAEVAGPPPAPDRNATARLACADRGGAFTGTPKGAFVCVTPTGDGNTACSGGRDCEGDCLARSRSCAPVSPLIGCHDILTNSGRLSTVCIE